VSQNSLTVSDFVAKFFLSAVVEYRINQWIPSCYALLIKPVSIKSGNTAENVLLILLRLYKYLTVVTTVSHWLLPKTIIN
jgi:hypothetical protein